MINEYSNEVNKNDICDLVFELKNVNFAYSRYTEPVLHDISFKIKRGEYVGIVGPTVSGKSTL